MNYERLRRLIFMALSCNMGIFGKLLGLPGYRCVDKPEPMIGRGGCVG